MKGVKGRLYAETRLFAVILEGSLVQREDMGWEPHFQDKTPKLLGEIISKA